MSSPAIDPRRRPSCGRSDGETESLGVLSLEDRGRRASALPYLNITNDTGDDDDSLQSPTDILHDMLRESSVNLVSRVVWTVK